MKHKDTDPDVSGTVRKIKNARSLFVRIKFMSPVMCVLIMVVLCFLPNYRLANDETERVPQSAIGLAVSSARTSALTLKMADKGDKVDVALAKSLRVGDACFWIVFAVEIMLALIYASFAALIWSAPPCSSRSNILKLKMKVLFPGRWAPVANGLFAFVPLLLPYYILDRFKNYYLLKSFADQNPVYYDYSISFRGFNPLIVAAAASAFMLVLQFVGREWDGMYKLDLFRNFDDARENV